MAFNPKTKETCEADKQLGCFPQSNAKLRNTPGNSRERTDGNFLKTSRNAFEEKEKKLTEIRSYWQEEYKRKVSEVANLEASLKEAVESRNNEVEELRESYESALSLQNSEISQLRQTVDELMGTKEEIFASAEKSTENRLRAKDAELLRLRIWLEAAKKSNFQGREVVASYQNRLREKEMEIEALQMSKQKEIQFRDQEIERLKAILAEVMAEKDQKTALLKNIHGEETKLSDLHKKFERESQEKQVLQQRCDSLVHDLDTWNISMKLVQKERDSLENQVKRLGNELGSKSSNCCKFQYKVQSLECNRQNLENVIGQLRKENADLIQGQKNMEFVIQERDQQQDLLKEKLSNSEKTFALEIEQRVLREEKNTVTLENLKSKYEETRRENDELKVNLDEREKDVTSLSRLLENAKQQEQNLEAELDHLSEELEALNEKYVQVNKEKEELEMPLTNAVTLKQQELEEMQQNFEKGNSDHKNEMEKRPEYWNEALKAKDDLLRDVTRSFEERVMWKEGEIRQLEKSLEETKIEFQTVRESLERSLNLKEKEISLLGRKCNGRLKEKEEIIEEITARNKDILGKRDELRKELKECKAKLDLSTEVKRQQTSDLALTKEKIAQLETKLLEKEDLLKNSEKELGDLQSRLKKEEENYVIEIKDIIQSAEVGFKERENVAEKLKATIQENTMTYHLALQKKEDKIAVLKSALENSENDLEDMRVNMATLIQESGDSEAKLRHDLKKLEDERSSQEDKISQLTNALEQRVEELKLMEGNMTNAVSDFDQRQKRKDEEREKILEELNNTQLKMRKLEEANSLLKFEVEQKESLERELHETLSNLSKLQDNFNQVGSLLKLAENEKRCVEEVKQDLLKELETQRQFCEAKDEKINLLLQKIKTLKKNHFEVAQKLEKIEENVVTLQIKLNEKETETSVLRNERDNKEEEVYQRSVLLEKMGLKKDELEKQITTLENTVNGQKTEIKEAKERENELKTSVQELLAKLKDNELNAMALVSNVKGEKAENEKLCSEYQSFKASALKEQDRMHNELDHLHSELERHEGLLLTLNKEKESLLTELGKLRQSEEDTKANLEWYIRSMKREKENLLAKLATLDKETKQSFAENSELYSALKSAKVTKEFLAHEIENAKVSALAKETCLLEARKSLETALEENSRLKYDVKSLEASLNRELNEKNNLLESFEEMKSFTSQAKQKTESVLLEKEKTISNSENLIRQMKEENVTLRKRLSKCEEELRADKKCVVSLLEKRKAMTAQIDSLSKDKEILNTSLKDMDLFSVKLKTTEGKKTFEISLNEDKQATFNSTNLINGISCGFYSFSWSEVSVFDWSTILLRN